LQPSQTLSIGVEYTRSGPSPRAAFIFMLVSVKSVVGSRRAGGDVALPSQFFFCFASPMDSALSQRKRVSTTENMFGFFKHL
jgi:hypothetical protein